MADAPDRNVRDVLVRAATDPAFLSRLLEDRESALKDFPLSDAERTMLMSASPEQIRKMVEQARPKPGTSISPLRIATGVGVAGVLLTIAVPPLVRTHGIRPEEMARSLLADISYAQHLYQEKYGRYGNLEELTGGEKPLLDPWIVSDEGSLVFEIKVDGDSFTAIARRRNTDRAWQVGPDYVVKPLE
jgi:hypothetical protein